MCCQHQHSAHNHHLPLATYLYANHLPIPSAAERPREFAADALCFSILAERTLDMVERAAGVQTSDDPMELVRALCFAAAGTSANNVNFKMMGEKYRGSFSAMPASCDHMLGPLDAFSKARTCFFCSLR